MSATVVVSQIPERFRDRLAISVDEFRQVVPVSRRTVQNWIKNGELKANKMAGRVLIPIAEVRRIAGESSDHSDRRD